MKALIVAGSPEPSSAGLVARLCDGADFTVAADRGAEALRQAGRVPDLVCGDEDSASAATLAWARREGLEEERFPWKKDDTDLGLAFRAAEAKARSLGEAAKITVTCASGGRADHALGVFGVAAEHAAALGSTGGTVALEEDGYLCRILVPGMSWTLGEEALGHVFSAISLAERTLITERGMLWEVERTCLGLLDDRGVSNRIEKAPAEILCHEGMVAAFLLKDPHEGAHAGE